MKSICLFFQIHQPFRHRRYRFFDIGNDHYYYDDYTNESIIRKMSDECYLPVNKLFIKLANKLEGKFKISLSISGVALEQLELYAPEVINSFQKLAKTGCVEFIAETYSYSLAVLKDRDIFESQVKKHEEKIIELFEQKPKIFRNTEMIYSDKIGETIYEMGYAGMLTEGAKHILGWKSPNFLYVNAINPRLKILMRNYKLSNDIAFRFSDNQWAEYPLTASKIIDWLENIEEREEVVNLFMGYDAFKKAKAGKPDFFSFFEELAKEITKNKNLNFATPSQIIEKIQPVSMVNVPHPISWADEERDLSAWTGNKMQKEAFEKLYELKDQVANCNDKQLKKDWDYLQESDHFYYMSTKHPSTGNMHKTCNYFDSPYEAFINYMNVLSDFKIRLNTAAPLNEKENEIAALQRLLKDKEDKIKKIQNDLNRLQNSHKKD